MGEKYITLYVLKILLQAKGIPGVVDASKETEIFVLKAILLILMGDLLALCDLLGIINENGEKTATADCPRTI